MMRFNNHSTDENSKGRSASQEHRRGYDFLGKGRERSYIYNKDYQVLEY